MKFKTGDILNEDVEALVNTVNCVGAMGRGIALQFKKAFPENFRAYEAACKRGDVRPGAMFIVATDGLTNPRYIINFPTKRHWRGKSRLEDIQSGLAALRREITERDIRSIAIPPLGSGLGGLEWPRVRALIEDALAGLERTEVIVFEPNGAPDASTMARVREAPGMTPGRAALVALMARYVDGLLDPFVSLLEIHKLMYFLQEAGEPLRLDYRKASRGPYAAKLRHVLNRIEGHLTTGYADGGDAPDKAIDLIPGALQDAEAFLQDKPETRAHLERVKDLAEGFESPAGLELLATVHWVATREAAQGLDDVVAATHAWNEGKKGFTARQIGIAHTVLGDKGWLNRGPKGPHATS